VPDRSVFIDAGTSTAEVGILQAGAVQGNVPNIDGTTTGDWLGVFENHIAGTADLAEDIATRRAQGVADPGLDVVLWPEDSADADPQVYPQIATALDEAARLVEAPLLIGSQEYPESGGRYNVLLLWQADHGVTARYAKQRPVAFGEYIPWRPVVRLLTDQVDRVNTDMIGAVNEPIVTLPAPRLGRDVPLGVGICFEVAYDGILRAAVQRGAQVLVVPTNNASFGRSPESTQQLQMVRLQAIATGRAVVQISTNGVSGVVAPDGTLVARTGLFTADRLNIALPLRTTWTPAVGAGQGIEWGFSGTGALLAVGGLASRIIQRRVSRRSPGTEVQPG
jgi:apolipoprotein N-acyltransferase